MTENQLEEVVDSPLLRYVIHSPIDGNLVRNQREEGRYRVVVATQVPPIQTILGQWSVLLTNVIWRLYWMFSARIEKHKGGVESVFTLQAWMTDYGEYVTSERKVDDQLQ